MEREQLTFATEKGREVPELGHVERLKDLTLVGGTITYNTGLAFRIPNVVSYHREERLP